MWVRRLKFPARSTGATRSIVALHVGAWIEITPNTRLLDSFIVALHVGAWIEIDYRDAISKRGAVALHVGPWIEMHMGTRTRRHKLFAVALHVGAWIEIIQIVLTGRITGNTLSNQDGIPGDDIGKITKKIPNILT
jgi:hypothetical protein